MEEHIRKDYRYRMQIAIGVATVCFLSFLLSIYAGTMSNKENAELYIKNGDLEDQLEIQKKQNSTLDESLKSLVNEVQELKLEVQELAK